jgi:hypothetical protein
MGRFLLLSLWLVLTATRLSAEILPHYTAEEVVLYSNLIVVGTQVSAKELRVEKVVHGEWKYKNIAVTNLPEFGEKFSWIRQIRQKDKDPQLSGEVVAFLVARPGGGRIVANGLFRLTKDGRVFGYAQDINPGGYYLQPKPAYQSRKALLRAIGAGLEEAPKVRTRLMRDLALIVNPELFSERLDELAPVTRGDQRVIAFVEEQMKRGPDFAQTGIYFLQNRRGPESFAALKARFQKTKDVGLLYNIGHQGTPAAADFLAELVKKKGEHEPRQVALHSLQFLYQEVEEDGDTDGAAKVRDTIFALYDKEPFARATAPGYPRLFLIPHAGAVQRLEEMLGRVRGDRSNREFEIERVLGEVREKMRANRK